MLLASAVILGILVTLFIGFVLYINAPVNVYGRDLSQPREQYNQRMASFSRAKLAGTVKSYAQSITKQTDYKTMLDNFSKGLDIKGRPLYRPQNDEIYQAFGA